MNRIAGFLVDCIGKEARASLGSVTSFSEKEMRRPTSESEVEEIVNKLDNKRGVSR